MWLGRDGAEQVDSATVPDLRRFLTDGHVCLSSIVIRREVFAAVGGFNPLLRQHQDSDLVARLLAAGELAAPVDEALVRVRLHSANASRDYWRGYREKMALLDLHGFTTRSRWRYLYGAQAYDAFRATREPVHLLRALRLAPKAALSQMGRFLVRR